MLDHSIIKTINLKTERMMKNSNYTRPKD